MNKIKYGMSLSYRPAFWLRCLWSVNWGIKILGALSLCLIIVITFDVNLLKIGYSVTADKYNSIFLNLSYSVVAAVIFHFLVVHIPYYKKKEVYRKRIKRQVDYMQGMVTYTCYVELDCVSKADNAVDEDTFQKISTSFKPEYFSAPIPYLPTVYGISLCDEKVKLERKNLLGVIRLKEILSVGIEEILKYDDYAEAELIENIMSMKGSSFFRFVNTISDDTIITDKSTYNSFVKSVALTMKTIRNIIITN